MAEAAEAPQQDHIQRLFEATKCLEDTFVVQSVMPAKDLALVPRGEEVVFPKLSFPFSIEQSKELLPPFLAVCKAAPFGHGKETVVDSKVRDALVLPAGWVDVQGFDPESNGVLKLIHAALVPDAGRVVAEFDKVNVYTKGGHFVTHRDTPADEAHFGTLVVCLPSPFNGGDFHIMHGKDKRKMNWAFSLFGKHGFAAVGPLYSGAKREAQVFTHVGEPIIQWVAFFGHCEHYITPVEDGTRITLSYKLRRADALPGTVPPVMPAGVTSALVERGKMFSKALAAALNDPNFMPKGCVLGFPCAHLYVEDELPEDDVPLDSTAGHLDLKGADVLVAVAAATAGLRVEVARILHDEGEGENHFCRRMPDSNDARQLMKQVHLNDSLVWGGATAMAMDYEDLAADLYIDETKEPMVEWVVELRDESHPRALWVEDIWTSGTGYYGNEASQTSMYTQAAVLVTIPPAPARAKLAQKYAEMRAKKLAAAKAAAAAAASAGKSVGGSVGVGAGAAEDEAGGEEADAGAGADAGPTRGRGRGRGRGKAATRGKGRTKGRSKKRTQDDEEDDDDEHAGEAAEAGPAAAVAAAVTPPRAKGASASAPSTAAAAAAAVLASPAPAPALTTAESGSDDGEGGAGFRDLLPIERLSGFTAPKKSGKEEEESYFKRANHGERLRSATIPQLKALLRTRKQPLGGKKGDLVGRALACGFTPEDLDAAGLGKCKPVRGSFKPDPRPKRPKFSVHQLGGLLGFLGGWMGDGDGYDDDEGDEDDYGEEDYFT